MYVNTVSVSAKQPNEKFATFVTDLFWINLE
jgi:hypothetical protein